MKVKRSRSNASEVEQILAQLRLEAGHTLVPVDRLVDKLKVDCGQQARIEVIPTGTTHGGTQRKFTILLVSKKQKLNGILNVDYLDVVDVASKRSGAFVSTEIFVKVDNSLAHPQPTVN